MAIRLALRALFKAPFVTTIAILSLALGIGANTAIFSVFDQILRRPLPVPSPDRLVNLSVPGPKPGSTSCNQAGDCEQVLSYPMFRDLERAQQGLEGLAGHVLFPVNLSIRGETTSRDGMLVSGSYFSTLGLTPASGRLLGPQDDAAPGESHVVVLSHGYWTTRLNGDPQIVGQSITVNGQSLTVVGIAPAGFDGTTLGARPSLFVPVTLRDVMLPGNTTSSFENRRSYWLYVFGRLKPGVSLDQARTALNSSYSRILSEVEAPLQTGMSEQTMARFKARQVGLADGRKGQTSVADEASAGLSLLLGVTVLVVLIACANIANLLLARSAARTSEMAVRLSIGASRRHLIVQLMTESMLLAAMGGIAGLLVARWTLDLMMTMLPADVQQTIQFRLDWSILPFAAAMTVGTGILFGLFPALHTTRPDLVTALKGQAGQPGGGRAASRFRTSLATAQIALSMALLVAAGLFTKSLINVARVDLGLNPERVVMFRVAPGISGYSTPRARQLFEQMEERLAALPGVESVTSGTTPLLSGSNNNNNVRVEGFEMGPDTDTRSRVNRLAPGYFKTFDIPLLAGRDFTNADVEGAPKVAIVNEAFLKKFNLGMDAVGRHIGNRDSTPPRLDIEIVGIAKDAKYSEVRQEMVPTYFTPYRQSPVGFMTFYVKTRNDPEAIIASVRKAVAELDANLPLDDVRTLTQQIRDNVFLDRFIGTLASVFALLATLLAAIGLYGVLGYTVSLRTREIGLRMALGAAPARVRNMVLSQVGVMLSIGGGVGLLAAVWIGSLASALLFEMKGWDPLVLASAAITLGGVALLAGYVPARRAARIDPMVALRYE
jgi:predicted permease